jgi:tellurite resistance protein TerC
LNPWPLFILAVLALLALDLFGFSREDGAVPPKRALALSAFWASLALAFGLGLVWRQGWQAGLQFFTGYLLELSLSVDNLLVFVLIFSAFHVESRYQRTVLLWGVLGALAFRGLFIGLGAALVARWHWVLWVFGAFLLFTALRMAFGREEDVDPEQGWVLRLGRRFLPMAPGEHGGRLWARSAKGWLPTSLFLVLLVVETSDLAFAVDSIPAVFGVTTDPFIVFTSNVFAVLGLRSLYFALAGLVPRFSRLKQGLALALAWVGLEMLAGIFGWQAPVALTLVVVAVAVSGSVIASLIWPAKAV